MIHHRAVAAPAALVAAVVILLQIEQLAVQMIKVLLCHLITARFLQVLLQVRSFFFVFSALPSSGNLCHVQDGRKGAPPPSLTKCFCQAQTCIAI